MKKTATAIFLAIALGFFLCSVPSATAGGGDPKAEVVGKWQGEVGPSGRVGRMTDLTLDLDGNGLVITHYKKGRVQAGPSPNDMKPEKIEKGATAVAEYVGDVAVLTITLSSGSKEVFEKKNGMLVLIKSNLEGSLKKIK